jgi:hypothetical protein
MALTGILLVPQIIITVVMVFLGALLLMLSAKIFKLKDESYITPLKVTVIVYVLGFVLSLIGMASVSLAVIMSVLNFVVMILLGMYLIKVFYKIEWGKAALTWLVWFIFSLVASFIIGLIMAAIFAGAMLSAIL